MTKIEFVSNVGGLLGLFIGFSLISGIEIIYWLTIGYAENSYARRKQAKISMVSSSTASNESHFNAKADDADGGSSGSNNWTKAASDSTTIFSILTGRNKEKDLAKMSTPAAAVVKKKTVSMGVNR